MMPMGPGVDSDTASMFMSWAWVNQPVASPMSWRKGSVAIPPPMAKSPVLKNSQNRRR